MKEKALETEEQRGEFQRKIEGRLGLILVIVGILYSIGCTWGIIYFQHWNEPISWIFCSILGAILIFFGILSPISKKNRELQPNYIPLSPEGWATFFLTLLVGVLLILLGGFDLYLFNADQASNFPDFILFIFLFGFGIFILLDAFFYLLPQARRSVYLHFRLLFEVDWPPIPMSCWQDETFSQIFKRLTNKPSFKHLLAKLQILPNATMTFQYHQKYLNKESSPTQEGMHARSEIYVIIQEEEILGK